MFKKIKSTKTTKKLSETITLSWEAHEKFLVRIREELKKRPSFKYDNQSKINTQNKAACKIMRGAR